MGIPELKYKIARRRNWHYSYCDYENTIYLGFPKHTHERAINHEVLHHVVLHVAYGELFSAMTFDRLSRLDTSKFSPEDIESLYDAGFPISLERMRKFKGRELG